MGVAEIPAWWNVGGTAFHECVREWELSEERPSADTQAERFAHHLANATADAVLSHPNCPSMSMWRAARGREDRTWWLDNGPEMVANYVLAQQGREYEILVLPNTAAPAMETEFDLDLGAEPDGYVLPPIKGFIDQILIWPRTGDITVRDLKSGSTMPADSFQLKVYRLAAERALGIDGARWFGDYWRARKGASTSPVLLDDVAAIEAEVRYRTRAMDEQERRGYYAPNPSNLCGSCGVRAHCPTVEPAAWARFARLNGTS